MTNVAFVTYNQAPNFTDDDIYAAQELTKRGITVTPALWDSETVDWKLFDLIVMRSPWDYYKRFAEFSEWLNTLEGLPLWNPLNVIRWNYDKSYMRDLQNRGVPIVPTVVIPQGAERTLEAMIADHGWLKAIVKPTISAGAYETWMTEPQYAKDDQAAFDALLKKSAVMIQPFIPEITQAGEWSFIFFDKQFSHAVLKKPRPGDFRVQPQWGGTTEGITEPPAALLAQAELVLNAVTEPLLYARVDGVEVEGKFLLMELELIEPRLFFHNAPDASVRFADAVEKRLKKA
jgi:glutathione synthase/RimK-type ligase-like ATP-grasp enzyme